MVVPCLRPYLLGYSRRKVLWEEEDEESEEREEEKEKPTGSGSYSGMIATNSVNTLQRMTCRE